LITNPTFGLLLFTPTAHQRAPNFSLGAQSPENINNHKARILLGRTMHTCVNRLTGKLSLIVSLPFSAEWRLSGNLKTFAKTGVRKRFSLERGVWPAVL